MGRTPEVRLDRLERIARLFVTAGLRVRRDLRGMDEKLNILVNHQIRNEERFARNEERFARNEERFARNEERLAKLAARTDEKFAEVAEFQAVTERRFAELVQILRQRQTGNSLTDNG
jgi:hypothetical protein